jgi:hypothetical protein
VRHAAPRSGRRNGGNEVLRSPSICPTDRALPLLPLGLVRLAALILLVATLLAWQLAMATPAHAKAGDLDPSFGTGGKVTTDIGGSAGPDQANALAVQADGK